MKVKISDPSNESIIDRAASLVEVSYEVADNISDSEYEIKSKLKYSATDLLFYISLAEGGQDYSSGFEWANARKNLIALRSMHRLADRRGLFEIRPEIMVSIDRLTEEIDYNIKQSEDKLTKRDKSELEPWLKKYNLWKEMQK